MHIEMLPGGRNSGSCMPRCLHELTAHASHCMCGMPGWASAASFAQAPPLPPHHPLGPGSAPAGLSRQPSSLPLGEPRSQSLSRHPSGAHAYVASSGFQPGPAHPPSVAAQSNLLPPQLPQQLLRPAHLWPAPPHPLSAGISGVSHAPHHVQLPGAAPVLYSSQPGVQYAQDGSYLQQQAVQRNLGPQPPVDWDDALPPLPPDDDQFDEPLPPLPQVTPGLQLPRSPTCLLRPANCAALCMMTSSCRGKEAEILMGAGTCRCCMPLASDSPAGDGTIATCWVPGSCRDRPLPCQRRTFRPSLRALHPRLSRRRPTSPQFQVGRCLHPQPGVACVTHLPS